MFKYVFVIVPFMALVFSGCASDGMAYNPKFGGKTEVVRYFREGKIVDQQKVVINDREVATLTGVGVGAVGGAVVGRDAKGALIGAVAGGIIGAVVGHEIEAYETTINSKDKEYRTYLKQFVPLGSLVEFTVVDGKLKNVKVVKIQTEKYSL